MNDDDNMSWKDAWRKNRELRADNERLIWELAGCLTIAEAMKPMGYSKECPCITLDAVNELARRYDQLKSNYEAENLAIWIAEAEQGRHDLGQLREHIEQLYRKMLPHEPGWNHLLAACTILGLDKKHHDAR